MTRLEGKSDKELRATVRACEHTLTRLASIDVRKAVRQGKADALIAEGERAVASSRAASEELDRRESQSGSRGHLPESLRGLIPTRNRVPSGSHPAAAALQTVATFGHRELIGTTLVAANLSDDEGAELAALVTRLRTGGGAAQLSAHERSRYELLLGKCAGNEHVFPDRRREAAAGEKLGQLTKEAKVASLPRRVKYEEAGSVVLPRLAFEWLTTSRDASWTIADFGMLAVVRGMFANRHAALINGAHFERDSDGEDVLVTPEDIVFRHEANPHPMQGGSGQVNPAAALATLARNKWIAVKRGDGRFRIKLGEFCA